MKTFFTIILISFAYTLNAQNSQNTDTQSYIASDNLFLQDKAARGFNMKSTFFLPMLDNNIERFLAREIFGIEATLEEAKTLYYDMFTKRKEKELKHILAVNLDIKECYRIIPTQIVCYKYNTAGLKIMSEVSADKYVSYDFKNKKIVQLSDIVNANIIQSLAAKGLNVENATNIKFADDSLFINLNGVMLNIDITKFYTNMTDYAINLFCHTRAGLENKKEHSIQSDENLISKQAEFPEGTDKLTAYFQNNAKYPDMPKEKNQEINLLKQEQNMQHQQQVGKLDDNNKVIATFVINTDGNLYSIRIFKSANPYFSAEAYKAILGMPQWKPAITADNTPIKMKFSVPITFRQPVRGFGGFGGFGGM